METTVNFAIYQKQKFYFLKKKKRSFGCLDNSWEDLLNDDR
ncbi:hypothetical protein [Liquorilactobacillus uvarum]|nr:hypothetical protein [Liquorilactobacillus uvarum]